jgi:PD-(D/E)XK nuclease superfamily
MRADYVDHPYPRAVKRFPVLRQSVLSTFDNCGLAAFFETEYRKGWSTEPQGRGTLFHRFAAECLRTMAKHGEQEIPVDAALSILRETLRQADADRVCPVCGTDKIRRGHDKATMQRQCVRGHRFDTELVNVSAEAARDLHWVAVKWAHDNLFDVANLVDVERRLRAPIRYPDPRPGARPDVTRVLTGMIDALFLEGGVERVAVVDWKDMWGLPAAHGEGEDDSVSFKGYFQQRFYAWLIFNSYPAVQEVVLREAYVRYTETREATVSREDLPEIQDELASLAERFDRAWDDQIRMEQQKVSRRIAFSPTPGKWCSYCTRPSACPIPVFARGEGRITDAARAEQVARQLIVGERVVNEARTALRAWASTHGPIPVKDAKGKRAMGYVEVTRTKRPDFEQIAQLERTLGRPPSAAEIKQLYRTTKGTLFKSFTPPDVDESQAEATIQEQLEASIKAAQERAREFPPAQPDNVVELPKRDPSGGRRKVADSDQGRKR